MRTLYQFIVALFLSAVFIACKKDDNPVVATVPLTAITVSSLPAAPVSTTIISTTATSTTSSTGQQPVAPTGKFTLYNFKDNKTVANTDSATNKWDVGFRSTTIIVNGGAIRSGQGGAYIYTGTFNDLTTVPTSATFAQDQSPTQLAIATGAGNGWYNYNQTTNILSPIPGRIFVIRTGDGKYAKMEIISYYQGAPATPDANSAARYYTFRYIYQSDGSMTLR